MRRDRRQRLRELGLVEAERLEEQERATARRSMVGSREIMGASSAEAEL
jgi:hypothetical protein